MTVDAEVMVIGAGVIGLAVARALAMQGREVVILESAASFGTGVSSRNSEVIHAGLYYPPGSKKAALCLAGREALYAYCQQRHVDHRPIGKLIVATHATQIGGLRQIAGNALACGVTNLQWLNRSQVLEIECALDCEAALYSPRSGIVDSHGLMTALLADAQAHGAVLAVDSAVDAITREAGHLAVRLAGAPQDRFTCQTVVNAAGLEAAPLSERSGLMPQGEQPVTRWAKGNYFALAGRCPFTHLIYPLPEPGGLGVHLTLDLGGQAKFGPDVQWVDTLDYTPDASRLEHFRQAIAGWWPPIREATLTPSYAGVRPKVRFVQHPQRDDDFFLSSPAVHGIAGLYQLFNIESPGLTACLGIGDWVASAVTAEA